MAYVQHFNNYGNKYKLNNSGKQFTSKEVLEIVSTLDCSNESIKKYLKILTYTQDIDLQIKLFSMLSACLITNETCRETIILNNALYKKVHNILVKNRSRKLSVLFNFLTTLIYTETAENSLKMKSLVIHAQNMIRVSGCLIYMTNMFSDGMVFRDTWIALCQCLAETCRNSEVNQNYCSHLIPVCVSKCIQVGSEVLLLLESLLQNHERNINLFLEHESLFLFTKDTLLDTAYMQVLNTLISNPNSAKFIVEKSDIVNKLRDVLDLHGADSQAGQWAVVLLHHSVPYLQGIEEKQDVTIRLRNFPFKNCNATDIRNNTHFIDSEDDKTNTLFQNLQEIGYFEPNFRTHSEFNELTKLFNRLASKSHISSHRMIDSEQNITHKNFLTLSENQKKTNNQSTKLGFTRELRPTNNRNADINDEISYKNINRVTIRSKNKDNDFVRSFVEKGIEDDHLNEFQDEQTPNSDNFKPTLASTPNINLMAKSSLKRSPRSIYESRNAMRKRLSETKRQQQYKNISETKQRSMSFRIFTAINDSCASVFNTIKNIFKTNDSYCKLHETVATGEDNAECSFSFTNYMNKRDEYLRKKSSGIPANTINNSYRNDTCITCNDTFYLKEKFSSDEFLKQTVKKLKIGINLYGCDFKKISRALWPNETYMTPVVLYNLYRKLLLK